MSARYTIKDLLMATALIAVGIGGLCAIVRWTDDGVGTSMAALGSWLWLVWAAWCASGMCVGLGVVFPFGRISLGALWGFVFANVLLLALAAYRLTALDPT